MTTLIQKDSELVEEARKIIRMRYKEGYHHIGSALRTKSGRIFLGVHLEGYIGRVAVCGEAIAIGQAATAGDTYIDTIVAVAGNGEVVSPCGICRELISDYSKDAKVIINGDEGLEVVQISYLLPHKYVR